MIAFSVGGERFQSECKGIVSALYGFEAQRAYVAGSRVMAADVRRVAPRRKGTLRKAVSFGGVRPSIVATRGPSAQVRVNIKRGSSKAPHAHLVAGGTRHSQANDFFARATQASGERVIAKIADQTVKIIEKGLGK